MRGLVPRISDTADGSHDTPSAIAFSTDLARLLVGRPSIGGTRQINGPRGAARPKVGRLSITVATKVSSRMDAFAGKSLHAACQSSKARALFGRHQPRTQFPLLFKFFDCQQTLSVQVHPNDVQEAKLNPPDLGKTEAWVILAAEPGSKLYAGLKPGVDRQIART